MNKIYTLTCIPPPKKNSDHLCPTWTPGWSFNKEKLINDLQKFPKGFHEYYYMYIVIELWGEGLDTYAEEDTWFKYEDEKWVPIKKPDHLKHIVHWAIG